MRNKLESQEFFEGVLKKRINLAWREEFSIFLLWLGLKKNTKYWYLYFCFFNPVNYRQNLLEFGLFRKTEIYLNKPSVSLILSFSNRKRIVSFSN